MLDNSPIVAAYRERTPGSAALAERARELFPAGVTHDSRAMSPYAPFVERALGAHKWDVDGNRYVDYFGGHGALLLGHAHPEVLAAVEEALRGGTHFAANHEREVRWGEAIRRLVPCAERVRFTASGTEATLMALRLARAFTGREVVVQVGAHFHGWAEPTVAGYRGPAPAPALRGVPEGHLADTRIVPPRDLEALERAIDADVAAVILEPTGASWGLIPLPDGFVARARELTRRHGALLVLDEVVTGFRVSRGGAQAALGVTPDLATLAKIVAGGLPGGAVAGRKDILDALDADACAAAGVEKVPHFGTFNANPASAAAGAAALEIIETTDACAHAAATAERLRRRINEVLSAVGVGWSAYGIASSFHLFLNPMGRPVDPFAFDPLDCDWRELKEKPAEAMRKLRLAMLVEGVDLAPSIGGMLSIAHDENDVEATAAALERAIARLREERVPLPPAA